MKWIWKERPGERRGRAKGHAFEVATRRSLCRRYEDGPSWLASPSIVSLCETCRKEIARHQEACGCMGDAKCPVA
jgi:hypothetical protein